jgi:hypothetical protein
MDYRSNFKFASYPSKDLSISQILEHNFRLILKLRGHTTESFKNLPCIKAQDIEDLLRSDKGRAKVETIFQVSRVLGVSPETILGFDQGAIGHVIN